MLCSLLASQTKRRECFTEWKPRQKFSTTIATFFCWTRQSAERIYRLMKRRGRRRKRRRSSMKWDDALLYMFQCCWTVLEMRLKTVGKKNVVFLLLLLHRMLRPSSWMRSGFLATTTKEESKRTQVQVGTYCISLYNNNKDPERGIRRRKTRTEYTAASYSSSSSFYISVGAEGWREREREENQHTHKKRRRKKKKKINSPT